MGPCRAILLLLLVLVGAQPAQAGDNAGLRPFVGESLREFEARRRAPLVRSDDNELVVAADRHGHFFVEPMIGPQRVRMLVDTGASLVALSHEDAEHLSFWISSRDYTRKVATANGIVDAAPVHIAEMQVGDIVVRDVEAVVLPPGRLGTSLLGMTFLNRLSAFEISDGRLTLRQ